MTAGIEHRPGGRGKAHAAHVEVVEPCAVGSENTVNEGQAGLPVAESSCVFGGVAFDQSLGESVDLEDDDALGFGEGMGSARSSRDSARLCGADRGC